jgi:polyphosphate glucokinase
MPPSAPQVTRANRRDEATPRTLCIDIGGTGLKAIVAGPTGAQLTDRVRVETPRPATPHRVLPAIIELVRPLAPFDRASVGFPGVVVAEVTKTAPNLHDDWQNFALGKFLAKALGCPVRVLNDAGIQGYGVVEGKGVELLITLGTGMGSALFLDGKYVPNLELAHHPFRQGDTYEDWVGLEAFERLGKRKWNKHVAQVIEQIDPIWNPRRIYIGGGNAKHVKIPLPPHVAITSNVAGLLGGIALWRDVPPKLNGQSVGRPVRRAIRS